ncbi:amidohydrolase [Pollutibacter soli]|uniref:amidohydrolase n=1 Tax=Pollutibacter soli TaxID=3034157 RepID=UPI0030132925
MSSLTVSLVQTNLSWGDKAANLQMLEEKIRGIAERTELVVLPEMFSTGFNMDAEGLAETMDGYSVEWMKKLSIEKRVILTGSLIIREGEDYFNRLIWMLPNGESGHYDKRHCFSFAGEDEHYTPGERRFIASVKGWRINCCICYDLRFPVWSRQNFSPQMVSPAAEYDILLYVANWPERRSLAWKTLLRARAIENQCYVIGVNRVGEDGNGIYHSGDSMVIDPLGEILYEKAHAEEIHTIQLDKENLLQARDKFRFWEDADRFVIV